jgi:hypothetical protein
MSTVVYAACLLVGAAMGWVAGVEFHRWRVQSQHMRRLERAAELIGQRAKEREERER